MNNNMDAINEHRQYISELRKQLAERDARIAELEAALIQIKEHKCETYTTGDCLAHVGRYIGSPYTFNAICDTCVANYALRGEFEKLPRWTPDVVNAV